MTTILENITSVRASLDELEQAFRAAEVAVARYHELAGGLAQRLGAPLPVELLALPAPVVDVKAAPIDKASSPARVARRKAKPAEVPASGLVCFRAKGRDAGPCRGKVEVLHCKHACGWSRPLCEAHRENGRASMAQSAHVRVAHTRGGKVALANLQRKGAAARDGRPKHRTAKARRLAKAAEKERHPAPAVDRRALIAQRAKGGGKPRKRLPYAEAPSHAASLARRARAKAGGDPGKWAHGRVPELVRCRVEDERGVACGALVEPGECEEHLVEVHNCDEPTKAQIAAAFVLNNTATRDHGATEDLEQLDDLAVAGEA